MKSIMDQAHLPIRSNNKGRVYTLFTCALVITILCLQALYLFKDDEVLLALDARIYQEGLAQCRAANIRPDATISTARSNPRFEGGLPILLRNTSLINGDGTILYRQNVLMDNGVFVRVYDMSTEGEFSIAKDTIVYDVQGRFVTPGLVDMHSHAAVDSFPEFWGTEDTNEVSGPVTSQMRTIDAMNVDDVMIKRIMSGGITTSLILPGSANVIGGEAFAIKHSAKKSLVVEDYLVQSGEKGKRQRWLKMACGENPKRVYPKQTNTRMGVAWTFRHRFDQGRTLMHKQDAWCARAFSGADAVRGEEFPSDLELESIVGVLRGDVQINNHCYETQDLEMQIRNSREFGFEIGAFHHALDAWRVPDLLKDAPGNITIATFANVWGYKKEAFQASAYAGKILTDAHVPLAYKSDHPVTNSQHLLYQAQVATHYDLADQYAIKSVTSVPATSLGLGHRIGYIRPGYDADLVLWDSYPLDLGAHPIQVFVDGAAQFEFQHEILQKVQDVPTAETQSSEDKALQEACQEGMTNFVITGLKNDSAEDDALDIAEMTIVVVNGKVLCKGSTADCAMSKSTAVSEGAKEIHVENGHVSSGIITTTANLGLGEIDAESSTQNGEIDSSKPLDAEALAVAFDGLVFGGPHIEMAEKLGVVQAITAPGSTASPPSYNGDFLQGISTAFKLSGKTVLDKDAIVKKEVAVNFQVGDEAKGDKASGTSAISTQINTLRTILSTNKNKDNAYGQLANGTLPMVIEVHGSDDMAHLILLKQEFSDVYMVFKGATEGHVVAKELAEAGIPVLAYPRCMPNSWKTRRCLPGPPMSEDTNIGVLLRHGVKVALASDNDATIGEAYWEAAWVAKLVNEASDDLQITDKQAMEMVGKNVQEILRLPEQKQEDFVVFSGSPLNVKSHIALTVNNGAIRYCLPRVA